MTFVAILLVAVAVGVVGSMLGIGGGLMLVPILTLFLGVPVKTAIGCSLVSVIATSSAAQVVYVGRGTTHTRLGMTLEVTTTLGALAGGVTAVLISGRVLQGLFAAVLVWAAYSMMGRGRDADAALTGRLDTSFVAPDGAEVAYGVRHFPLGMAASFVAGNVSGLLGVGGGVVKVPVMNLVMRVPLRAAIATSNFMIGVTAATSAAVYFGRGLIEPRVAVPTALGILVGAQVGPRVAARTPMARLRLIFQVVLVVLAVEMVWKAVSG